MFVQVTAKNVWGVFWDTVYVAGFEASVLVLVLRVAVLLTSLVWGRFKKAGPLWVRRFGCAGIPFLCVWWARICSVQQGDILRSISTSASVTVM